MEVLRNLPFCQHNTVMYESKNQFNRQFYNEFLAVFADTDKQMIPNDSS